MERVVHEDAKIALFRADARRGRPKNDVRLSRCVPMRGSQQLGRLDDFRVRRQSARVGIENGSGGGFEETLAGFDMPDGQ
eukprot:11787865-Heterocapsa_arctica.AAC.1